MVIQLREEKGHKGKYKTGSVNFKQNDSSIKTRSPS